MTARVASGRTPVTGPVAAVDPDVCAGSTARGRVPLVALLGRSETAFVAEFDRRIAGSEFCSLSLAHSRNVLRHLGDGPRRASQLVEVADISKQALSQQVAHLERGGYLTVAADPTDQRARILTLTPKGERAQVLVRRLFNEIEADWSAELGIADVEALRDVLTRLLDHHPSRGAC